MKVLNKIGISLVFTLLIVPGATAGTITNGAYASKYPDSLRIEIKDRRYRVVSADFPDEGWRSRTETKFKRIKSGVFYNPTDKDYYCSIARLPNGRAHFCTKNGWKAF